MTRGMSERRRAFLAMQGVTFPRVGARGRYIDSRISLGGTSERAEAAVEVVSITASGKTAVVRFVSRLARKVYEKETFDSFRRGNGPDGSGWYLPHKLEGLPGEVVFSDSAKAALPWRLK